MSNNNNPFNNLKRPLTQFEKLNIARNLDHIEKYRNHSQAKEMERAESKINRERELSERRINEERERSLRRENYEREAHSRKMYERE